MRKVLFPNSDSPGVCSPFFAEDLKPLACLFGIYRTIDSLQFLGEPSPFFAWNVPYGVTNQMHDAPLHHDLRKNGVCPFLQTCHAIHREESDRLHTARFEFIENLHPCMLAFRLVDPKTKHISAPVRVIGENDMYRRLCRAPLPAQRNVEAVHKDKGIKRRKGGGSATHGLLP